MHRFARECAAAYPEFTNLRRPFSNFDFVDRTFPGVQPLRRVLSQVRAHGAKTMVTERLDIDDAEDLREENADLQLLSGDNVESHVWRLSFFRQEYTASSFDKKPLNDGFLGYVILKHDESPSIGVSTRVFESVILPGRHDNNYTRGSQRWSCCVASRSLTVDGYLYAQQNGLTNSCAHVACRTVAARFHHHGDMTYREMNNLPEVGIDHVNKKASEGLASDEIEAILGAAGATCFIADYTAVKPGINAPPFQKCLYGSIESGYPAILFFATEGGDYHAIPVFGHTFNEDIWVPNADRYYFIGPGTSYIPSEQWLSMYIAHDDNWGPNYCIPRHSAHQTVLRRLAWRSKAMRSTS